MPSPILPTLYQQLRTKLQRTPRRWLITGAAGFIGSNLLETLLALDQEVVGLDDFSTGHQRNLDEVRDNLDAEQWARFHFVHGDIRNLQDCRRALNHPGAAGGAPGPVEHVLHQAALGSVPRSINDPLTTNSVNVDGFLNMLVASQEARVSSFTYAASSSTYGDHPGLPKVENVIGKPLSPYAVTKYVNELYADVFARHFALRTIGLRYFNVFGKRQDPEGDYAAVIPRWIAAMIHGDDVHINGDGHTSRDFCFVENTVQANLLAAMSGEHARNQVYNVAVGARTTLSQLFAALREELSRNGVTYDKAPVHRDFRAGDVRHSLADIGKIRHLLGYDPQHDLNAGIASAMPWYIEFLR